MAPSIWRLLAVLLAALPSWPAVAGDYSTDEQAWNGIGYLRTTAEEAKVQLEVVDTLSLDDLSSGDVLLWLYPQQLPSDELLAFVKDGGSLIIADDRGGAEQLFEQLGMARMSHGPTRHERWYQNEDGFPVVQARGDHFLFFNVTEVVANHPAVLRGDATPVLSFDGGEEHLVMERLHGAGAVLGIGDPSMFLNEMLRRFYGNKQFAANVMRIYCQQEPCELRLVLPDTLAEGSYKEGPGRSGALPRLFERAADSIDAALAVLSDVLGSPPWALLLAFLLLAVGVVIAALSLARWRVPVSSPGRPLRSAAPPLLEEAAGLAAVHQEADFFRLARTLVEHAEHLAHTHNLRPAAEGGLADATVLRAALLRVKRDAASLRARQPPVISSERFSRIYDDVQTITRFCPTTRRTKRPGTAPDRDLGTENKAAH